jgi:hypothetical protein
MSDLYETDFYEWANQQAQLLREGRLADADVQNLAEEIESMGRGEKRELASRLNILLLHLLKWRHQPARRGTSWRLSILKARKAIVLHLRDNPSLKSRLDEAMADAYDSARLEAAIETGIDENVFPQICPWSFTEVMREGFWPEA